MLYVGPVCVGSGSGDFLSFLQLERTRLNKIVMANIFFMFRMVLNYIAKMQ
jgi:hypothetical protein